MKINHKIRYKKLGYQDRVSKLKRDGSIEVIKMLSSKFRINKLLMNHMINTHTIIHSPNWLRTTHDKIQTVAIK